MNNQSSDIDEINKKLADQYIETLNSLNDMMDEQSSSGRRAGRKRCFLPLVT